MANNYSKFGEFFEAPEQELEKADIRVAAMLNGYMMKRSMLGNDVSDIFYKLEAGQKLKSFVIPANEKELASTEKTIIGMQLGKGCNENNIDYFTDVMDKYEPEMASLLLSSMRESLIIKNNAASDNVKKFYNNRIKLLEDYNNARIREGEGEKV